MPENESIVMPKCDSLIVSTSPHIQSPEHVTGIMLKVVLALLPALIAAVYFFGLDALYVTGWSLVACVGAEALWCLLAGKPVWNTLKDCSAVITGLLLGMNLAANVPLYVCIIGAFLAIWLGKQVFGGLGNNPFNPALVARVALLIALPALMTTFGATRQMTTSPDSAYSREFVADAGLPAVKPDFVTCATPLTKASMTPKILGRTEEARNNFAAIDNPAMWQEYFLGNKGGCLGEVCVPALLLGGLILIFFNLIDWKIPLFYLGTVAIFTGIIHYSMPGVTPTPIFHLLTGGVMLGAIFMATDMVTSPMTSRGAIVFAIGCGVITCVIRIWCNYPEGVSFSILFMNALVPLIDRTFGRLPFGFRKAVAR